MKNLHLTPLAATCALLFLTACNEDNTSSNQDSGTSQTLDMPADLTNQPDDSLQDMPVQPFEDMEAVQDLTDMTSKPDADATPDLAPTRYSASWAEGNDLTLQTMRPRTLSVTLTPEPEADVEATWAVTSKTAQDVACDALISDSSVSTVELTLPGDADPRCADELTITYAIVGQEDDVIMQTIEVVPSGDRVVAFMQAANNPQPALQTCPEWDCLNHTDATIGRLPGGELGLWFAATGDEQADPQGNDGFPAVGRVVGQVDGTWTFDEDAVMSAGDFMPGNWDRGRETPSIRWNAQANAWDMWYLGYNDGYFVDPAIGQSRSLDAEGTEWPRPAEPIYRATQGAWDESFLSGPTAMQGSDGVWRLYYAGASTSQNNAITRIGVLTSEDGETWTPYAQNPVFAGSNGDWDYNVLDAHVQFVGGRYVMWYTALAGQFDFANPPELAIGVATSEDGYTWTRLQDTPIITPMPLSWTSSRITSPEVLLEPNGDLLMVTYAVTNEAPLPESDLVLTHRIGFWRSALPQ